MKAPTLRQRENRTGLGLISPTLLVVLVVVVLPVVWTLILAFQRIRLINIRDTGLFERLTLRNFVTVFDSPGFWSSLGTTLAYAIGGTILSVAIGLAAALALRRP